MPLPKPTNVFEDISTVQPMAVGDVVLVRTAAKVTHSPADTDTVSVSSTVAFAVVRAT
jgi:hypothetical protein